MRSVLAILLAVGWIGHAAADDTALQRCRVLNEPLARLACYDAIPLARSHDTSNAPTTPQTTASDFGLESRRLGPVPVASIESAIDGAFDGWLPRGRLTLANGQVWEIIDGSQAAYDLRSPRVSITRGMSGSFFMAIEGVAQTPRVRRVR